MEDGYYTSFLLPPRETDSIALFSATQANTVFEVNEEGAFLNGSKIVTEERLKSLIEDVISTQQENALLKKFSSVLLERLYGEE